MTDIDWAKGQLCSVTYDDMNSCNVCGAENSNDITVEDILGSHISEASTKCKVCGHEDYWAYGTFESNQWIVGKAKQV